MKTIMGTIRNGEIVADEPIEWPEFTRVIIEPAGKEESLSIPNVDSPTDQAGITPLLVFIDPIEPLEQTKEDEKSMEEESF